jgi:hypothetical protein
MTRSLPHVTRRLALWGALLAAGIGVAIALNVVLLGLAGERDDPVGRLSPIAAVPAPGGAPTAQPGDESRLPTEPATTGDDDDERPHGHDSDDD